MEAATLTPPDALSFEEQGLHVPLQDGRQAYFNYYWLRDNCASSFDSQTRERKFDIFHLDAAPAPEAAWLEESALLVRWRGEDQVSRYPLSFLAAYAGGAPRPDIAAMARRPWYADQYPKIARFSQPELMANRDAVARWVEALIVDGVAIVTDMPDSDEGLTETAHLLGQVRPTIFGVYFDVFTHINPTNLAYTAGPLELHTDMPSEETAPGIQYLHCRANTVEGGRSLFADGVAVANDFRARHPEDFQLLAETRIPYYNEHDAHDMRTRQHVIELDDSGAVSGVTISQHMADIFDMPQREMDRYYPAFCRFGRMLQEEKYLMKFMLKGGECIVFDNHRIVHGREGYTASSGSRYLRGCYTDREEMRSTYRAIRGQGRFR